MNEEKSYFKELRKDIQEMQPNNPLHKLLKLELGKLNLWVSEQTVIEYLKTHVPTMQRWQPLYRSLKELLTLTEHWKNRKRGDPEDGYKLGWGKFNKRLK